MAIESLFSSFSEPGNVMISWPRETHVIDMNYQLFKSFISTLTLSFKQWNKYFIHQITRVEFASTLERHHHYEFSRIPYNREHNLFELNHHMFPIWNFSIG
jgi:hypothetical protein